MDVEREPTVKEITQELLKQTSDIDKFYSAVGETKRAWSAMTKREQGIVISNIKSYMVDWFKESEDMCRVVEWMIGKGRKDRV